MVVVKVLQGSDFHFKDDEDLEARVHAMAQLADKAQVDAAFLLGDFFNDQAQEYAGFWQLRQEEQDRMKSLPKETVNDYQLFVQVQQLGGPEKLVQLLQSGQLNETDAQSVMQLLQQFEQRGPHLKESLKPMQEFMEWRKKAYDESSEKMLEYAKQQYQTLNAALESFNVPLLGVRGNHDFDGAYEILSNITFVEQTGGVNLKGLIVQAAPNVYEHMGPQEVYKTLERDLATHPQDLQMILQQIAQKDGEDAAKEYMKKVKSGNPYDVPEHIKEVIDTYKRLQGKPGDILLTHKGPDELAKQGDRDYGSGIGLYHIIQEMEPSIILGGHIHDDGAYDDSHGYQGLRSSDKVVYINHIDTDTKKLVAIDIYKWDDKELVYTGTKQVDEVRQAA